MTRFINRSHELGFLEKKYKSGAAELLVFYGRRRIGKTELLLNFAGNKRHMYFLGRMESKIDTIRRFNMQLIDFFKDVELAKKPLESWDEIFDYLASRSEKRNIIIFDEFPFIVDKFPEGKRAHFKDPFAPGQRFMDLFFQLQTARSADDQFMRHILVIDPF